MTADRLLALATGGSRVPLVWSRPSQVLRPSGPFAAMDEHRAWRPSVLEARDRSLHMWYAGHDGTTTRVLKAESRPGRGWDRRGPALAAGLAGASDAAGVGPAAVLRTDAGLLMAYVGSDGESRRVHVARSDDGWDWQPCGVLPGAGGHQQGSPSLASCAGRLWLYSTLTDAAGAVTLRAATSVDGTAWRDVDLVVGPGEAGPAIEQPWVVAHDDTLLMLSVDPAADDPGTVRLATSSDGRDWVRRGALVDLAAHHHDAGVIEGPAAFVAGGGRLSMWYAAGDAGDPSGGCRLWATEARGRLG